jgi:hypothetical protein
MPVPAEDEPDADPGTLDAAALDDYLAGFTAEPPPAAAIEPAGGPAFSQRPPPVRSRGRDRREARASAHRHDLRGGRGAPRHQAGQRRARARADGR